MEIWEGLGALGNPEELWSAFKTTIFDVAVGYPGTHHWEKKNFVSQGTLDIIDQRHRTRFNGRAVLFRKLRHKTVHALRVERRIMCEESVRG